jgi:hypothetical protein
VDGFEQMKPAKMGLILSSTKVGGLRSSSYGQFFFLLRVPCI